MPLSLLNHSALALFAQRTRIPTSARSIGFCAIWVCISSSSSSPRRIGRPFFWLFWIFGGYFRFTSIDKYVKPLQIFTNSKQAPRRSRTRASSSSSLRASATAPCWAAAADMDSCFWARAASSSWASWACCSLSLAFSSAVMSHVPLTCTSSR